MGFIYIKFELFAFYILTIPLKKCLFKFYLGNY